MRLHLCAPLHVLKRLRPLRIIEALSGRRKDRQEIAMFCRGSGRRPWPPMDRRGFRAVALFRVGGLDDRLRVLTAYVTCETAAFGVWDDDSDARSTEGGVRTDIKMLAPEFIAVKCSGYGSVYRINMRSVRCFDLFDGI